jgi:hypothetical protein
VKEIITIDIIRILEVLRRQVIIRISPDKLRLGGAAMFEERRRNHHRLRVGVIVIMPLLSRRFRVWVRS